jgi:hypothetical protein
LFSRAKFCDFMPTFGISCQDGGGPVGIQRDWRQWRYDNGDGGVGERRATAEAATVAGAAVGSRLGGVYRPQQRLRNICGGAGASRPIATSPGILEGVIPTLLVRFRARGSAGIPSTSDHPKALLRWLCWR